MLYELLAFCQLQLRGHAQKCWRNFLSGCAAGRRTAGKPPPLRNSCATLDVQVVLSSYTAPSRFYPPILWIINMWCPYRLWKTLYSVHPAAVAPLPYPERPENTVASLDRTAHPEKMSSEGISVIGVFAVGHRRGLGHN